MTNLTKNMKQYDLRTPIRGQLISEEDSQPVDLSNATIQFIMFQVNHDGTTTELVNSAAVVEGDVEDGSVIYEWAPGDTAVIGMHLALFRFVFSDDSNRPETFPANGWIHVEIEPSEYV